MLSQSIRAMSEMLRKFAVFPARRHGRLESVIGFFVVLVEREHAFPDLLRRVHIFAALLGSGKPLVDGATAFGLHALRDLLQRDDACRLVPLALCNAFEGAPSLERFRIKLACFQEGPHRARAIAAGLATLCNFGPAVCANRRRRHVVGRFLLHPNLDLGASAGRVEGVPQLSLDLGARSSNEETCGALEESRSLPMSTFARALACRPEKRLHASRR